MSEWKSAGDASCCSFSPGKDDIRLVFDRGESCHQRPYTAMIQCPLLVPEMVCFQAPLWVGTGWLLLHQKGPDGLHW